MSNNNYSQIVEFNEYSFPVYVSKGSEMRAHQLARRCQQAYRFFADMLEFQPTLRLLILAPEHWEYYTGSPMFGIPQTIDKQTVAVAGQNAELWKMIVPPLDLLPPSQAQALQSAYGQAGGSVDVAGFMDLLAVHEVGHVFIDQKTGQFDFHIPRRWLIELFCNLGLHAFVATHDQDQILKLEVYPQVIVNIGNNHLNHRTLDDFEQLYAGMEPPNFAWYQCKLHVAAKKVYDAAGSEAICRLFKAIVESKAGLSDEQLAKHLRADVHPEVADVLVLWEN